jgi:hypothetical protein
MKSRNIKYFTMPSLFLSKKKLLIALFAFYNCFPLIVNVKFFTYNLFVPSVFLKKYMGEMFTLD